MRKKTISYHLLYGLKACLLLTLLGLITCFIVFAPSAYADQLYLHTTSGTLNVLDTDTGIETVIGNTGLGNNVALSFAADGTLYGLRVNDGLYTFDINTGQPTLLGNPGALFQESLTFDLAGNLFTASSSPNPNFYQLDPLTGAATLVGNVTGVPDIDGLTVAPVDIFALGLGTFTAGTFFAIDTGSLYAIDPNSLVATLIDPTTQGNETLAFAPDGTMYLSDRFGDVYSYDFATGNDIFVASTSLSFGSAVAPSPVPEPSTMLLLGSGLFGLIALRKRFKK